MIHVEFLVEEPSAELVLRELVPKIAPRCTFGVRRFQGKQDLLRRLPGVLRGYATRLSWEALRIVVLVDRDHDDCRELKRKLAGMGTEAGLRQDVIRYRVVVDELEAWFFGDVPALRAAYDRLPAGLANQARYRDSDAMSKASRALEDLLRSHGYHRQGLAKTTAAGDIAPYMDVENNRSQSFRAFRDGLRCLVSEED